MRATVVIAAHNEGTLLGKTVDSVKQTLGSLEAEIVVVDDASTDGSAQEVQRAHPDLKVVAFSQRAGVSRTKDRGARVAARFVTMEIGRKPARASSAARV